MEEIIVAKIHGHFSPSLYSFVARVLSDGYAQKMSNGRGVWDALCDTTP
jgi:hypothetical protein